VTNNCSNGLFITIINPDGKPFELNVLSNDGKLMTNRIRNVIAHRKIVSVDPIIGHMLVEKYNCLQAKLIHTQDISRTTESEILHVRKSIRQSEELYTALFGACVRDHAT